jgi:hypothetical protein
MLERLGRLCGWIGNGVAVVLIGSALFLLSNVGRNDESLYVAIALVVVAIAAFLIGQAIRFVLVPSKKPN